MGVKMMASRRRGCAVNMKGRDAFLCMFFKHYFNVIFWAVSIVRDIFDTRDVSGDGYSSVFRRMVFILRKIVYYLFT
jgi:hypothetical protein